MVAANIPVFKRDYVRSYVYMIVQYYIRTSMDLQYYRSTSMDSTFLRHEHLIDHGEGIAHTRLRLGTVTCLNSKLKSQGTCGKVLTLLNAVVESRDYHKYTQVIHTI